MKCYCLALVLCFVFSTSFLFAQSNVRTAALTFTTIDVPGAGLNALGGINSTGTIVGYYAAQTSSPHTHGFSYKNGTFTYIDYAGAWGTLPTSINDSGMIVGYAQFDAGVSASSFLYDGVEFSLFQDGSNSFTEPLGSQRSNVSPPLAPSKMYTCEFRGRKCRGP